MKANHTPGEWIYRTRTKCFRARIDADGVRTYKDIDLSSGSDEANANIGRIIRAVNAIDELELENKVLREQLQKYIEKERIANDDSGPDWDYHPMGGFMNPSRSI